MQQSTTRSNDIQTAGEMMMKAGTPAKPVDCVTSLVISKKVLSGNSRYSYCPFCYQRIKRAGLDYKAELRPLLSVTYKNLYRVDNAGTAKIVFEKTLECPVCRDIEGHPKKITLDDFCAVFAVAYKEHDSLFVDLNDMQSLKKAGVGDYAEFGNG